MGREVFDLGREVARDVHRLLLQRADDSDLRHDAERANRLAYEVHVVRV